VSAPAFAPLSGGFEPANPRHMTAALAAAYVAAITAEGDTQPHEVITVNLIRVWAHRGYVKRVGKHPVSHHALYDLEDIMRRARDRGLLAS
jgi:hypothetical protein